MRYNCCLRIYNEEYFYGARFDVYVKEMRMSLTNYDTSGAQMTTIFERDRKYLAAVKF